MTMQLPRFSTAALLLWASAGCATVPGNTVASPTLQRDTLQTILALDAAEDQGCNQRKLVKTDIIKGPAVGDKMVVERWTLDRCGKMVPYTVTFTPSPRGGTDFRVWEER